MSGPVESAEFNDLDVGSSSEETVVRALPLEVHESVLLQAVEKRRLKRGMLAESEEQTAFGRVLYLPYLDFSYNYTTTKGLWSKQAIQGRGRSALLALREVEFGFIPELTLLTHHLVEIQPEQSSIVRGVDSIELVSERLEDLRLMLTNYDNQLHELTGQYVSLGRDDPARQEIKDTIDHLRKTRENRWKMFADGLSLPSRMDLDRLELIEGSLFYIPYFISKFVQSGESNFLVLDRAGKEDEALADELKNNHRFRELIENHTE